MSLLDLTPQQRSAVQLYALGVPRAEIASELGINRRTLYDWERYASFQQELSRLLHEAEKDTRVKLRSLATLAVGTLEACMSDSEAPWPSRITAAMKVLSLVLQEDISPMPLPKVQDAKITPELLKLIRREVYGIEDPPDSIDVVSSEVSTSIKGSD
jgi:hypothetical protein